MLLETFRMELLKLIKQPDSKNWAAYKRTCSLPSPSPSMLCVGVRMYVSLPWLFFTLIDVTAFACQHMDRICKALQIKRAKWLKRTLYFDTLSFPSGQNMNICKQNATRFIRGCCQLCVFSFFSSTCMIMKLEKTLSNIMWESCQNGLTGIFWYLYT